MSRTIRRLIDFVDPETGEVRRVPARFRKRDLVLDELGRLKPDPRPVMAAVAFGETDSAEVRIQRMIDNAMAGVQARIDAARDSGADFADRDPGIGDDNMEPDEDIDPRFVSPFEFVPDADLGGRTVPRALKGAFKSKAKPPKEDLDPKAPKVAPGAKDSPSAAGKLTLPLCDPTPLPE